MPERNDTIRTSRLILRRLAAADAGAIHCYLSDDCVRRMLATPPTPYRHAHAEAFVKWAGARRWERAIDMGGLVGVIGITEHLGYWLGRPHWGQGLATEAARALIGAYFEETTEQRITSGHFIDNPASGHVLRKLGFRETGRRFVHVPARGADVSHVDMALERSDWEAAA